MSGTGLRDGEQATPVSGRAAAHHDVPRPARSTPALVCCLTPSLASAVLKLQIRSRVGIDRSA